MENQKVRNKKVRKNRKKEGTMERKAKRICGVVFLLKIVLVFASIPVMSAVFILGHDLLTQSNYFKSEHIIIEGAQGLSEKQVKQQAGIEEQTNIFAFNLFLAQKKLMAHPWIKQAQVARKLPNTIYIRIAEQIPLAVVDLGEKFIVNTDGLIFKRLENTDPENLPVIEGLSYSDLRTANDGGSPWFLSVMEVLQLGNTPASVLANHSVRRIEVDRQAGLLLHTTDQNRIIKLGFENYSEKYAKLERVIFNLKSQYFFNDYSCIDLINPDRIVVYPVKNEFEADQKREA
ncbi:MAG: FtsQ-type POTRA domain-containing protein [Desulfobacterales bacterium]